MKIFTVLIVAFFLLLFSVGGMSAQTQTTSPTDNHTARGEAEGKAIWEKLQAKETSCDKLSEDDFERFGEYFMGQMAGSSHEAMNNMMVRMMGEEGEKQMHIAMGKRNSDCGVGFMPMMSSVGGNMIGGWDLLVVLFWLVVFIDLVLVGIWLLKQIQKK